MKRSVFLFGLALSGMYFYGQSSQDQLAFVSLKTISGDTLLHERSYPASTSTNDIENFFSSTVKGKTVLGYTKKHKPIELYYFPGTSTERTLIIGGVHGSELSSVELAGKIIELLSSGEKPYYNVLIIPSLFPDNADLASNTTNLKVTNLGRYTNALSADPNRQMPGLGKTFDPANPYDSYNRLIEHENQILLQLIQTYKPSRIANLHAIRDVSKAGIFADPRTDCKGFALGYEKDSSLAINMAKSISEEAGKVPGNHLQTNPTSLYHHDPAVASVGFLQARNLRGSSLPNNRGYGVSLGGWATTAVCEGEHVRDAIQLITVEFPGYKSSADYTAKKEKEQCLLNIRSYAMAVTKVFLGEPGQ